MLRNPDQIARLCDDPALIDPMVEEVLRFQAPIQINNRRSTTDQVVGGIDLPAGTAVHMIVAAATATLPSSPTPTGSISRGAQTGISALGWASTSAPAMRWRGWRPSSDFKDFSRGSPTFD